MLSQATAQRLEHRKLADLTPYPRNPRRHSDTQIAQIAGSIAQFGFNAPILIDSQGNIIAGHGRHLAAQKLGLESVPVIVLDHLSEVEKRAYLLADNKLAELSGWEDQTLAEELAHLRDIDFDLGGLGFSDDELAVLLADAESPAPDADAEEKIPEAPAEPVTRAGDIWSVGRHRLVCGDCRDRDVVHRLLNGARANLVVTSPPYATQREYDPESGFTPVPPEAYCNWFRPVAANIAAVLASDGSYFLNIKEHADGGQRSLYVKDLLIAHVRQFGWWFIDEFCWRKTDNGVPGGWGNRFKNAWEPVFHFSAPEARIKFRPTAVGHVSEDCFDYSPNNPKARSGSGLLGTGARGAAAGKRGASDDDGRFAGIARPSNVIEVKSESSQGSHSAPFPRGLAEFFVKAFSDPGDLVYDCFAGSATTIAAAHVLSRVGYGCEISPAYCDVSLRRLMALTGEAAVLQETRQTFAEVAQARGVPVEYAANPKQQDARRIRHNGTTRSTGPNGRQVEP
jgi:DNA modification methylase